MEKYVTREADNDERETVRVPAGKVCRVCDNVFALRGIKDETGKTPAEYFKSFGAVGGRGKHQEHLNAVKAYINAENTNQMEGTRGSHRMSPRQVLAGTVLTKRISQGTRTTGQKETFVTEDAWDEAKDGTFVASNMKLQWVHGALRKGCWVKRGREGVFEREVFAEQAADETEMVDNDEGQFGKERLDRKRAVAQRGFQDYEKMVAGHSP